MMVRDRRGQFVVISAFTAALVLFLLAGTVFLANNRVQQFRYSGYREVVENLRSDHARLLTYSLKSGSWERAIITSKSQLGTLYNNTLVSTQLSASTYGDLTTIRTNVGNKLGRWANVTTMGLGSYGLSLDPDAANLILIFSWNTPDSNSTIRKKLSFNLTSLGFTGFVANHTIALRAILNTTYIVGQGATISTLRIRVLDGAGNPKTDLSLTDFYAYNLNAANIWITWSLSSAKYEGNGTYLLTLTTATARQYFLVIVTDGKDLLTMSSYHP